MNLDSWLNLDSTKKIFDTYDINSNYFRSSFLTSLENLFSDFNPNESKEIVSYFESKGLLLEDFLTLLEPIFCKDGEFLNIFNSFIKNYTSLITKKELHRVNLFLEQYKKAVDSSSIVSKSDLDGNITYVNDKFCEISGYDASELLGEPHNLLRHKNMPKDAFENLWSTIKSKRIWSGIVKNRSKSGKTYVVDATIVPILNEMGEIIEYIGIRKDITKVFKQQEELKVKQEFVKSILDSQRNIILVLNLQKRKIDICNKPFLEFLNIENIEQFREKHSTFCELFAEVDSDRDDYLYNCAESRKWFEILLDSPDKIYKVSIDREGKEHIFKIEANKLSPNSLLVTLTDITSLENYKIELEAKNRELIAKARLLNEYKKAVDVSSIVSKSDLKGIVTYVNDKFCEISGYTKEEIIGKPHSIVRHPNMPKEAFEDLWNTIRDKRVWNGMVENRSKDGTSYFVDATIVPILDENEQVIEYIGIRKDITKQILKERELDELRIKQMNESLNRAIDINYENMLETLPLPATILNEDDIVIYHNESFYNIFNIIEDAKVISDLKAENLNLSNLFIKESGFLSTDDIYGWRDEVLDNNTEKYFVKLENSFEFEIFIKAIENEMLLVILVPKE